MSGRGGKREGAGAKLRDPFIVEEGMDPLEFLRQVMSGHITPSPAQLTAAIAAARLIHGPSAAGGKKSQKERKAAEVGESRFTPTLAPVLRAVNG